MHAPQRPTPPGPPPTRRRLTTEQLVTGVRGGDRAVLGRAITLVESNHPDHRRQAHDLLVALLPASGRSQRIGVTGVPGVGKSTFIERFGELLSSRGHRVAVLAVDPSSSISGGSILGDKTRMPSLAADRNAFIRPSPTGGSLGGVGRKTRETIIVCEAAGYDVILVETVGVGQSETIVADMVDLFLVLMLAGAGDELQGIKRGILELADIIAITKADSDNRRKAERARAEYQRALELLRPAAEGSWAVPVVSCSALERTGLGELWALMGEHRRLLEEQGRLEQRRRRQLLGWMWSLVDDELQTAVRQHPQVTETLPQLERSVLAGTTTPTRAAESILQAFGLPEPAEATTGDG